MENRVDNSLRSFTAHRSSEYVSASQLANGCFIKKHYHTAWQNLGIDPDIEALIMRQITNFDRNNQNLQADLLASQQQTG